MSSTNNKPFNNH